ncbi:putative rhomboid protein [Exophiala dermatitidis]
MAANDYYNEAYMAQSQQSRPQYNRPVSHIAFAYNSSQNDSTFDLANRPQQAYSPQQPNAHYHHQQNNPPQKSAYSDNIPLKHNPRLNTNADDLRNQPNQYPPSPESPSQTQLLQKGGKKKTGWFSGKIPWVVYTLSLVQITVFIVEIIKNSIITGSPIMIHPQFNPMIGPSTYVQINMGARFVPCMRVTPGVQDSSEPINWPCPNTTTSDASAASNHCDLKALCGFSGFSNEHPNQWFRFIVPMFLHAGLVHIAFNLMLQLTMAREMEKAIGSIRFALVYFSSGIFGFVLGGNFAASAIASTGASGCLFGVLALTLLDLIYGWNERRSPVRELMWILVDVLISFVLGLLPGLDNFSHIGGFLMGLAMGICILHSPNILRKRNGEVGAAPYRNVGSEPDISNPKNPMLAASMSTTAPADVSAFTKHPLGFFKARKPLWWAWWLFRAGALIGVLVAFVVLLNNFYKYHDTCSWCKYLSCLPIKNWCDIGNLQLSNSTSSNNSTSSKRDLLEMGSMLMGDLFAVDGI